MNFQIDIPINPKLPIAFVVYDFETLTAFTKEQDAIELGAVIIYLDKLEIHNQKFEHFIKPNNINKFDKFTTDLTGIVRENVENAEKLSTVLNHFENYTKGINPIFVAQNAIFDYSIIRKNLPENNILVNSPCIDLIRLVRYIEPDRKTYNLDALAGYFEVPIIGRRHRGLYDSELTAEILIKVLKEYQKKEITSLNAIIKIGKVNKYSNPEQIGLF